MNEKELEKVLKALANKRRIAILKYLRRIDRASVGDVSEAIKLSFKATSKHLRILSGIDIIDKEQESLTMFYFIPKINHPIVSKLLSIL